MSQDIINKNQDISYTNLDFSSIYTELIDLAKQLSYRWDPSISDESDPGVVLLKLSALIADKMNYNIDKSVLEAFPLSVTQEGNARQLYEQLGYYMNWYESATVPINMTWIGTSTPNVVYTIPKFTMITDSESSRTYALIGTFDSNGLVVSDGKLPADGSTIQLAAMEGTPAIFSFLGETKITSQMVDENNRLYFETKYVSQNGIFIRNSGNDQDNYLDWKRVDNLYEQPYNDLRYKFGIDSSADVAYIEFPDNYAELIGSGIEIVYMIIDPDFTNIPAKSLDRFLVNVIPAEDANVTLTIDTVKIENTLPASGHKNVESINEAYTNYKRTVGTFKTLITLRDYINYILLEGEELCSNGFVTDRSNDPQLSYKIMSKSNGIDSLITEVESDESYETVEIADESEFRSDVVYYTYGSSTGFTEAASYTPGTTYFIKKNTDKLTPFDLKFYLLQDAISVNSKNTFNQTFEMIKSEDLPSISALIDTAAHIEHTYEDILPLGRNEYQLTTDTSRSTTKSYYYYDSQNKKYDFISNVYYSLAPETETTIYPYYTFTATPETENFSPTVQYYSKDTSTGADIYTPCAEMPTSGTYYTLSNISRLNTGEFGPEPETEYFTLSDIKVQSSTAPVGTYTQFDTTNVSPEANVYYKYNPQYNYYYRTTVEAGDNPYALKLYLLTEVNDVTANPAERGWYEIKVEALSPHIAYLRAKYPLNMTIATYSVVGNDIQKDIKNNVLTALYEGLNSAQLEFGDKIELDYLTEIVLAADTRIKSVVFDNIVYEIEAVYYDEYNKAFVGRILPTEIALPNYEDENSVISYNICKDIIAKSILAGTTKLLDKDTDFAYHLNQFHVAGTGDEEIYTITSETIIDTNKIPESLTNSGAVVKNYTLKENEVINLIKPKLQDKKSFENGVHYEYLVNSNVNANTSYKLSKYEYMIFYTTQLDANNNIDGYTCRIYTNGAIIKPSFNLQKQANLSALSDYFKTQIQPSIMLDDKYYYEFETHSIYWVTSILNNSSIINNMIGGNDKIVIQLGNTVTISPADGYKFYWHLNKEQKAEATGKRFFELFGEFDSETDKRENGLINTYTLKSGEVLYYVDKDSNNLAILHEGSTITRNCGTNADYSPIPSSELFGYTNINDIEDIILINDESGKISPVLNGLYELYERSGSDPNYTYFLSTDTELNSSKSYFVLTMNSASEWYEVEGDVYSPASTITYDVFKPVNISDSSVNSINPQANNYYEQVNYSGLVIEDYYNASNLEPTAISRPRYKLSSDTSVLEETIFTEEYNNFKVNDTSTYEEVITIDSDTAALYSPLVNGLFEVSEENPTFYNLWVKTGDGEHDYVALSTDSFYRWSISTDTVVNPEKTYYTRSGSSPNYTYTVVTNPTGNPSTSSYYEKGGLLVPVQEGWYDSPDPNYLTTKIYSYKPKAANKSTATTPFVKVNSSDIESSEGLYYTFSEYDTDYRQVSVPTKYISYAASSNRVPERLLNICEKLKLTNPTQDISFDQVDQLWSSQYSTVAPSDFRQAWFTLASEGDYYFVSLAELKAKPAQSIREYISELYVCYVDSDTYGFCFSTDNTSLATLFDRTSSGNDPSPTYNLSGYTDWSSVANSAMLNTWYDAVKYVDTDLTYFPLYLEPNYYKFRYLVSAKLDNYYELKTYADKTFGTIDPWECDSLTLDSIVENPAETLSNLWKPIQDNCSITIVENEVYSLAAGDTISIISNQVYDENNSTSLVSWPIFSNTEIILNLYNYSISYVKDGSDVVTIDSIEIPDANWRAYSNLLVNTSSSSGQVLADNHTVIFYNDDGNAILTIPDDLPQELVAGHDIIFQLRNPVDNKAGSSIEVVTYDDLGNEIPNGVYVFYRILGSDKVSYLSTYDTLVEVKTAETYDDLGTEIPFGLPQGKYLLPLSGEEGINTTCTALRYLPVQNSPYETNTFSIFCSFNAENPSSSYDFTGYEAVAPATTGVNFLYLNASEVNINPADISTAVGYYSNIVSELHTFKSSGSSELISLAENDSASVSLTKLPIEESTLAIVAHTEIPKTITVSDMEYTCEDIIGEQLSETLVIPISILRNESTNTKTGNVKVATLQYTHEETTKDVSISVTYELEYTATTTTVTLTVANTFDSSPTVIGTAAVKDVMYAAENVLGTFPAVDLFTEYRFTPEQEEQMLTLSGGEILPVYSISSSQPVAQTIYEFNAVDSVYKKTTDTVPSYEEVLGSSIEEFEENVTYYERSGSSPNYVYTETDDTTPDSTKTYYTRKDYRLRYEEAVADYATGATTFIGNKSYFLYIDTEDVTHATALAFTSNSSTPSVIVLGDSFKFTESALLADVFDEIFTKVKALDSEAVYNYTFQPSENDLIENPLLPRTFWDKNHVYNSNIIAQLNLNSADNINYRFITSK